MRVPKVTASEYVASRLRCAPHELNHLASSGMPRCHQHGSAQLSNLSVGDLQAFRPVSARFSIAFDQTRRTAIHHPRNLVGRPGYALPCWSPSFRGVRDLLAGAPRAPHVSSCSHFHAAMLIRCWQPAPFNQMRSESHVKGNNPTPRTLHATLWECPRCFPEVVICLAHSAAARCLGVQALRLTACAIRRMATAPV